MLEDSATGGNANDGGSNEPPPSRGSAKKPVCGFCECVLAPSGAIFDDLSSKAKKLRDSKQEAEDLRERLQVAKERITELETQLREARAANNGATPPEVAPTPQRKGYTI